MGLHDYCISFAANGDREAFVQKLHPTTFGLPHTVVRQNIFKSVMSMYRHNTCRLLREYPPRIRFANERALDTGGVSRDMFSAFFKEVYEKFCDGSALLTLVVHPHIDFSVLPSLGTVISHGYLACRVLPIRIAFPTLA